MNLLDIAVPTGVARPGMCVGQAFEICVRSNVPGVPFCNEAGYVTGRFSIRHIVKTTCIPEYMIGVAHLLGDHIDYATITPLQMQAILKLPVEPYILGHMACVAPDSPVDKALAIMEQSNTGYIFLLEDQKYIGVVTRMGIAALMLQRREEPV